MSVTHKRVGTKGTDKKESLNEVFSYFRWKSFNREMEKKRDEEKRMMSLF